jgi:hypothetical protein
MPKFRYSILNTARWETETITEWLAYYKSIGFDHVYLYCNDDDPSELYGRILPYIQEPNAFVTFHHLPYQGQQDHCWIHFLENHKKETEWFLFLDADEFLALKGVDNIRDFMAPREDLYDCIYFNWIWFGPQDFAERPGGSTLLQFIRREDHLSQMNFFTKTLTRSACVDENLISRPPEPMLNHNWPPGVTARLRRANVLGHPMDEYFSDFPASAERYLSSPEIRQNIIDVACLYHYLFRSRADFIRRYKRGILGAYYYQPIWKQVYESDDFESFVARLNAVPDRYLADYWSRYLGRAEETAIAPRPPAGLINLAQNSRPTQSSTCQWSNNPDPTIDALGAISGRHTGADGFHTAEEPAPWWMTDLTAEADVYEVRLFNSLKAPLTAQRAYDFEISVSLDGDKWTSIFRAEPRVPFGGVDGHPFILKLEQPVRTRYVRISLLTTTFFHLDQIEIYGLI